MPPTPQYCREEDIRVWAWKPLPLQTIGQKVLSWRHTAQCYAVIQPHVVPLYSPVLQVKCHVSEKKNTKK